MSRFTDRIAKSLNERMAAKVGVTRADLNLIDYKKIDKYSVRVAFSYDPTLGGIQRKDVDQYVAAHIGNYKAIVESVRKDEKEAAFSIIVAAYKETKPFEATAHMAPMVEGIYYCDHKLNDTWEVTKNPDGTKFLVRQEKEDLANIIAERAHRLSSKIHARTISTSVLAGLLTPNVKGLGVGDTVRFFYNGELFTGDIVSFGADNVQINPKGRDYVMQVPTSGIMDLIRKSQRNESSDQAAQQKYFEDAYGDKDYARQLVKAENSADAKQRTEAGSSPSPFSVNEGQQNVAIPQQSAPESMYYTGNPMSPMREQQQQPQIVLPPPAITQPQQAIQPQPTVVPMQQYPMVDPTTSPQQEMNIGDSAVFRGNTGTVIDISYPLNKALVDFGSFTNWIDLNALQRSIDLQVNDQQKEKQQQAPAPAPEPNPEPVEEPVDTDTADEVDEEPLAPINEDEDFNFGDEEEEEEAIEEETDQSEDPFAESSVTASDSTEDVSETEEERKYNESVLKRIVKHTPDEGHKFEGDDKVYHGPCWVLKSTDGKKIHRYLGKVKRGEGKEAKEQYLKLAKDHLHRIAKNM